MPQLNLSTYLSQCTWFIIIFCIFYTILKNNMIPYIFMNYKIKTYFIKINNLQTSKTNTIKKTYNL